MGTGHPVVPSRDSLARAGLRLAAVILVAAVVAAVSGCPRPRDCTPASQRCEGDTPVICDGEGRSWRASGEPVVRCAAIGGVCLMRDGHAYCGRPDAGVVADGGAP